MSSSVLRHHSRRWRIFLTFSFLKYREISLGGCCFVMMIVDRVYSSEIKHLRSKGQKSTLVFGKLLTFMVSLTILRIFWKIVFTHVDMPTMAPRFVLLHIRNLDKSKSIQKYLKKKFLAVDICKQATAQPLSYLAVNYLLTFWTYVRSLARNYSTL